MIDSFGGTNSFELLRRQIETITQEDIAAMAGTSRATVNRVLREEAGRGVVALARGRTTVLDVGDLERRCRRRS